MSRTSDLIDHIEDVIYQNDTQEITGAILQEALLSMVGVLGYPLADWANYTNDAYEKERPLSAYLGKQMNDRIAQLTQLYVIVSVLPTPSAQTLGKIYLIPAEDAEAGNYYEEYITIQRSGAYVWELVGSTKIDLSGYQTKITADNPLAFSLISGFQPLTIGDKVFNGSAALTITKSDLGLGNVENTALSTWAGNTNISTLGTITTGTWRGTKIQDTYIASAESWNNKYDKPSAGIPKEHLTTTLQTTLTHADTLWDVIGIDENGDVYVKKKSDNSVRNFYAFGDVSAGGIGTSPTPVSGGITAIKIGSTTYQPPEGSTIVTIPALTDAPLTGGPYGRQAGAWVTIQGGGGTNIPIQPEPPTDPDITLWVDTDDDGDVAILTDEELDLLLN